MVKKKIPEPVIGTLILNDKGEVLLTKSADMSDLWLFPGFNLKMGENFNECIKREVKAKTNLEVDNIKFFNIQEWIYPEEIDPEKHLILLDFVCKAKSKDIKLNKEFQHFIWIKPENAQQLNPSPSTLKFINKFLSVHNEGKNRAR